MSYQLDFPPSQLPHNAHAPPYVIFGIKGVDITELLPPQVPLNVVLHYAPKLKQWVLPPPSTSFLPRSLARWSLRAPHIGIDILDNNVDALGMKWIVSRILQKSGIAHPKSLFLTQPSIMTSISIHRTWLALDLPVAGIFNLHMHIRSQLLLGPVVQFAEMQAIWDNFHRTSDIVRAMGLNFIRSHIDFQYSQHEFAEIREWYLKSGARCRFFKALEDQFPHFAAVQELALKAAAEKIIADGEKKVVLSSRKKAAASALDTNARVKKLLERAATKKVSPEERKERQAKDAEAMRTRLRRTKSDESIRSVETVTWSPLDKPVEVLLGVDTEDLGERSSTGASWGVQSQAESIHQVHRNRTPKSTVQFKKAKPFIVNQTLGLSQQQPALKDDPAVLDAPLNRQISSDEARLEHLKAEREKRRNERRLSGSKEAPTMSVKPKGAAGQE